MNEKYGTFTEPRTLRFERLLPGPPERIWRWLTESEKKGKWLASGEVEPRVGGPVELHFLHRDLAEADDPIPEKYRKMEDGVTASGTVTRYDPPHVLSYTWGEEYGDESEVTFELEPQGEQVLLTLTHRRLPEDRDTQVGVFSGWHTHLGILEDRLNGREPEGFWRVHNRVEKAYKERV